MSFAPSRREFGVDNRVACDYFAGLIPDFIGRGLGEAVIGPGG
jgi:hypothetical protein